LLASILGACCGVSGKEIEMTEPIKLPELFVVRHYVADERPIIKGNGFDGLTIGEDREEAEQFVAWVNARLAVEQATADLRAELESAHAAQREAEREACAKLAESLPMQQEIDVRDQCAAAIRAMGKQ
jgi:hypothetical protein